MPHRETSLARLSTLGRKRVRVDDAAFTCCNRERPRSRPDSQRGRSYAASLGLHGVARMQNNATSANLRERATRCRMWAANAGDNDLAKELAALAHLYDQAALDLDLTAKIGLRER